MVHLLERHLGGFCKLGTYGVLRRYLDPFSAMIAKLDLHFPHCVWAVAKRRAKRWQATGNVRIPKVVVSEKRIVFIASAALW